MPFPLIILHAPEDAALAETLVEALTGLGYEAWHTGHVLVGDLIVNELSERLGKGGPVVICGTSRAAGSKWLRKILAHVQGPYSPGPPRVFPVRMEADADLEALGLSVRVAECCPDIGKGIAELDAGLRKHFPSAQASAAAGDQFSGAEFCDGDFDNWLTTTTILSVSPDAVRAFRDALRSEIRAARLSDSLDTHAFLNEANLLFNRRLYAAGVLLFSSRPEALVPSAYVQCVQYSGLDQAVSQDGRDFYGPIMSQLSGAMTFIESRIEKTEVIEPAATLAKFEYQFPMVCLREILANALCHRDYTDRKRHIHVRLFSDRIEVISPGRWVSRDIDNGKELGLADLQSEPASVNERLASAMRWIRLVETQGSGIPNALSDCREQGADSPRVLSRDRMIKVTVFPRSGWDKAAFGRRGVVRPTVRETSLSVYLASTAQDLVDYRKVADDTILRLSRQVAAMERFGPLPGEPVAECERKARESDVVVCIVAHRYGYVPEKGQGSVTQREVEAAKAAGKDVLVWIVADDHPWTEKKEQDLLTDPTVLTDPARVAEVVEGAAALAAFKTLLRKTFVCDTFTTREELGRKIAIALQNYSQKRTPHTALAAPKQGEVRIVHALQPAPHFHGRDALVAELTAWVADLASPDRVWSLVAIGGTGKTAVVERVIRDMQHGEANVLVWSFYEKPDADAFLRECNQLFLGEDEGPSGGRLERLERGLRDGRPHLIVLDGLERVQEDAGTGRVRGELSDQTLKLLLRALAAGLGRARALVTSRFPLVDLQDWTNRGYRDTRLDDLNPEAAVAVLRGWGVLGDEAALSAAAAQVGHHALSVAVLGSYLHSFANGRIAEVASFDLETVTGDDPKAAKLARVLAYYAERLPPEERELLARVSVFPRGVTLELLGTLIDAGGEVAGPLVSAKPRLVKLLTSLKMRGLVFEYRSDTSVIWTAHPFLRERFRDLLGCPAEKVFDVLAQELGAGLEKRPVTKPSDPSVLDRYERLIEATRLAGREEEAFDLFWYGLGSYTHLGWVLGDYQRGYRILAAFSATARPEDLAPAILPWQRLVLANALALFALDLGRVSESWAIQQVVHSGTKLLGAPKQTAIVLINLGQIAFERGRLAECRLLVDAALTEGEAARESVEQTKSLALRAIAAHAVGDIPAARVDFASATGLQGSALFSLNGLNHARHHLDLGDLAAARALCDHGFKIARINSRNDECARFNILLAHIDLAEGNNPASHLDEVRVWTSRTGDMRLMIQAHLLTARHLLASGDPQAALGEAEAGLLHAVACGYGAFRIELLVAVARIRLAWPDAPRAIQAAREALDLAAHPDCQYAWGEADAAQVWGEAYFANHEPTLAKRAFTRALTVRQRIEHPGVAETEKWLARVG